MHLLKILENQIYFYLIAINFIISLAIDKAILMQKEFAINF